MAYRIAAEVDGVVLRIPVAAGEHVLGSHPECAIRIDQRTVSRRHARLIVDHEGVRIEDLGSRNGVRLGSHKVAECVLEPGVRVLVGAVPVWLEVLPPDDLEAAVVFHPTGPGAATGARRVGASNSTDFSGPGERFAVDVLPRMAARLLAGDSEVAMAQVLGTAVFDTLPCVAVAITAGGGGIVFKAERDGSAQHGAAAVTVHGGRLAVETRFPSARIGASYGPLIEAAAALLDLALGRVAVVGEKPRILQGTTPALPDPPSVVDEVRRIYADAVRVATAEVSVLILGESGSGKELLARYLHAASHRAGGPLVSLNCASLPEDLLESELFGIERAVATGVDPRPGRFELADGGTLFLDEIGDMAPSTQAKILRVLQSGELYRLGATRPQQVDVRIVAATNRDLALMMADGRFRTDLYHRIATWVVELPPLRRRRGDIPNLAAHFLAREARRRGQRVGGISRAAMTALESYHWPGNVRQLENEMARAVLFLEDGELLDSSRLSAEVQASAATAPATLAERLEQVERDEIVIALAASGGDVSAAAARLALSRATLYRRIKALAVDVV